jgi:hypothetical protein
MSTIVTAVIQDGWKKWKGEVEVIVKSQDAFIQRELEIALAMPRDANFTSL